MKRVPIFACLMGLHAALAVAALLWALHVRFGDPLTAALCPAADSPWEQSKGVFPAAGGSAGDMELRQG
ncbi:MAG: hypothetical protein J7E00_20190, partial [Escherichia coli]|nr:hypothetical protein [Escherichia coli]